MLAQRCEFEVFADYHQFYLFDEDNGHKCAPDWTRENVRNLLTVTNATIVVGTVRNFTVPVVVEVHDSQPDYGLNEWDHVNDCAIVAESGKLIIEGCTGDRPSNPLIKVNPGSYRARVYYGKLDSQGADCLQGDDHYKIVLWPGAYIEPIVMKQWPGSTTW